jgi:hypothetical protein
MVAAQASGPYGDITRMGEFGTGLRAHLEESRGRDAYDRPVPALTAEAETVAAVLEAERRRLETLAAELAGKEFELAQREADLNAKQEQMALNLAQALIQAANAPEAEPQVDELSAYRARRYGA